MSSLPPEARKEATEAEHSQRARHRARRRSNLINGSTVFHTQRALTAALAAQPVLHELLM